MSTSAATRHERFILLLRRNEGEEIYRRYLLVRSDHRLTAIGQMRRWTEYQKKGIVKPRVPGKKRRRATVIQAAPTPSEPIVTVPTQEAIPVCVCVHTPP